MFANRKAAGERQRGEEKGRKERSPGFVHELVDRLEMKRKRKKVAAGGGKKEEGTVYSLADQHGRKA